ncbi:chromogranin-A isoform X1 [Hypanus sabinus]|uniref:chromogranin-A isoform X1 n=1 Tax=Hypanus sabinus TaxID=79690 RepID=UPI0028C4B57E|nr:chromogranin-A isoform X1 [Hypanus sabinus]
MITLIFFVFLLAGQASSSPVPIEHSKADTKVMNCVVEVISDTLAKPSPLPISPECLDALRGDERIIGMLRHQNLLRELQELAAEGANEKTLQKKQSDNYEEKQPAVLKNHDDPQENPAEEQQRSSTENLDIGDEEEEIIKEKLPDVRRHSLQDTATDLNSTTTDRDRGITKKIPVEDEPMESESSSNEYNEDQSQDQQQTEEHSPEAHDDEDTEEVGEDLIKASDEEESNSRYEDSKDEELTHSEEPPQEDWGDEAADSDSSDMDGNGKVSEKEIRSKENNKNSENVDKYSSKNDEKDDLSEEWEGNKRKLDELAPEMKLRKHEAGEEDKSIRVENPKARSRHSHFQYLQGNRRSHAEEGRQKGKVFIASTALRKRLDVEEGSATRKSEDQEVESLEEIESELEAMARRLHQMRSR